MATPSGAPPTPAPSSTNTTAPDKKKLFIALGVAGVAALGIGGYFVMQSMKGNDTTQVATAPSNSVAPATEASDAAGTPGSTLADGGIPPAGVTPISTVGNPSTLLPLSPYRRDPFIPFILPPVILPPEPPPPPVPTPTPPPKPIELPPIETVFVPRPGGGFSGGSSEGFAVPNPGRSSAASQPLVLPAVVIPRLNSTRLVPTNAFPPPRSSSGAGSDIASPSFDKRLSGVVIGNGVRAILEINNGSGEPKSYVVQPGDVVEGITVLSIRRYSEGGTQITRMLIRENGGERTVDLKPGPPRAAAGGGEFGAPGGGFGGPGEFGAPGGGFGGPPGFGGPGGFGGARQGFGGQQGFDPRSRG